MDSEIKQTAGLKRYLLIAAGILSLGLGVVGIVLPVLPTTPFFLLSAFCFFRSSRILYRRLIRSRVVGKRILLYLNHRTVSRGTKIVTISFLWVTIGISVFCVTNIYIRILLLFIAAAVTVHVALLGTCGRDAQNPEECGEEIKP